MMTKEQVIRALMPDEPNYPRIAAALGPDALPLLRELVNGNDVTLAARAASLAGRINDPRAVDVLDAATHHGAPAVRAAAAEAAERSPVAGTAVVLMRLLDDGDIGVRRVAIEAVPAKPTPELIAKVARLARGERHEGLRQVLTDVHSRMRRE
jgi:HEAT repeat protein